MAEYGGLSVWWAGGRAGPIDLADLPISASLRQDIQKWADAYDSTLNDDDPAKSGFDSSATEKAFEQEGHRLWGCLREQLPKDMQVAYFSITQRRLLTATD